MPFGIRIQTRLNFDEARFVSNRGVVVCRQIQSIDFESAGIAARCADWQSALPRFKTGGAVPCAARIAKS
jgi:hypothetical protein